MPKGQAALKGGGGVGILSPQPIGTQIDGPKITDTPGFVPPDTQASVGPTQILFYVNGRIRVQDKITGAIGALNTTTDNFWAGQRSSGTSDPRVRFDRLTNRWFVIMIDVANVNRILVACSDGPTITAGTVWNKFFFQHDLVGTTPNVDTGGFADYPSLGVDANALYIGTNTFVGAGLNCSGFVIRKSSVTSGGPIVVTPFRAMGTQAAAGPFAPQGCDNDDPAATQGYFIGVDTLAFSRLQLRRISNPGATPSISANLTLNVNTTAFATDQPCQGSTNPLSAIDDRLFGAVIKRDKISGTTSLLTAHHIRTNSAGVGGAGDRNSGRWYRIINLGTTPSLAESGTSVPAAAGAGHLFPSVAMSGQGHLALGFTRASSTQRAEIAAAGRFRAPLDAAGTTQAPSSAIVSGFNYNDGVTNPQRWGDYDKTEVDPTDDQTIWTIQQYVSATNVWAVRAVKLIAPPPATPTTLAPNTIAQGATNVNLVLTGTSASGSEFFDTFADYTNHIAASFSGTGITVNSVTFNSVTQVTINVSVAGGATTGARNVTITNPDGQQATGNGLLTVTSGSNPLPTTTSISPTSATAGGPAFTLTVNGSNFINGSIVRWNGADRTTTFVNSGQVTAQITLADIATAGTASVTVFNPAPGGGTSNAQTFTINNPAPTITTISPTSATAGGPAFTLTVNGTGFVNGSTVRWNGSNRTTTFVNTTQLTAQITLADIATAGTATVTVLNAAPGGGTSGGATFTINNPAPGLTSISPASAIAGGPLFTLTVNGSGFNTSSIVRWNGSNRTTTFVSATQVTAQIPATDIATAGTATVTVFNPTPGGGTSGGLTFNINNPVPSLSSLSPSSAFSGSAGITLTVNGSNFINGCTVTWNGSNRTTTFVNSGQVTAIIPSSDLATPGVAAVRVSNPGPGGGLSGSLNFTINANVVSGNVVLSDWSGAVAGMQVVIEIRNVGSTTPLVSQTVVLNASGNFTMNVNLAAGTYDVTAKASHWLRKKRGSQTLSGGIMSGQNFTLINGDSDGDNEVGIGDLAILSGTYNKSLGDPGYNPAGDLNGDDSVDIADYAILSANYGLMGDD
ncbi:MAG: hypothetical protein K1X67_09720 [Fimbriimonadaceae bacterium]|nr:hypothetical protein [Fimbriimonadaceae bacterium]